MPAPDARLVSAVYGGLTWAANSMLPALVLNAAGEVVVLTRWWLTGRPERQIGSTVRPLVWDGGVDAHFVLTVLASIALLAAYVAVRRTRRLGPVQSLFGSGAMPCRLHV